MAAVDEAKRRPARVAVRCMAVRRLMMMIRLLLYSLKDPWRFELWGVENRDGPKAKKAASDFYFSGFAFNPLQRSNIR